jgi:cell division protein FtsQ
MSEKDEVSRAEAVRQRHVKQNAKRVEQATQRAYRPSPAVASRKKGYAPAKRRPVYSKRRYNIMLALLPDFHLERPILSLPRFRTGWRPVSLFLSFMLGVAIYLVWTLPYFHATWATVTGNSRLTVEEINTALGISGRSIFMIQPEEVETNLLMNYPELAAVKVSVYLPNYVYVNVVERQPVILWQQGEGYTWIDSEGIAFRPRGAVAGLVPVLGLETPPAGTAKADDPLSPPPYISKELVDAILVLAPNVPPGAMMTYDPHEGLGWTDNRGWKVFFGTDARDMPMKVRVYQSLVDSLMARGLYPAYISVAYPDAPYYRMAQVPENNDVNE